MKSYKVEEIMVPLSEYAVVSQDSTLYEAVIALEKAQEEFDHTRYRHRAVLVSDETRKIVGKLSQLDILRALEPKYNEIQDRKGLAKFGFSKQFMQTLLEHHQFWSKPITDVCKKAGEMIVKNFMYIPTEGEYIEVDDSLDMAIHQIVLGHHQSLLVTRQSDIVGVLRLTDVFAAIFHTMKECFIE